MAIVLVTLLGLALRIIRLDASFLGDEMSTLYIVDGSSLGDVFSRVASDAEISPPLYFLLSWVTTHLGSAPELVRLPSLIAGVASIPLTYLVGTRAVGRTAGSIAALVMALSPFMVFYSTDGRAYAVAIFLLLLSTYAMLRAVDGGRARWWVLYGLSTLLAVYCHYTATFVLGAQLLWLLWAHPGARRPALLANAVAALLFLPWLPSFLADADSPTVDVLAALQGNGLEAKLTAVETWSLGFPYVEATQIPGSLWLAVALGGLVLAAVAGVVRWRSATVGGRTPSKGLVLVFALALATPIAEALLLAAGGTDLFGARNLNASTAGLALSIGAILAAAGPTIGLISTTAVITAYGAGAVRGLDPDNEPVDVKGAAEFIDTQAGLEDVVVDAATDVFSTPVPRTPLDLYLPQTRSEYRVKLPTSEPPFLLNLERPRSGPLLTEAFEEAAGRRLFLIAGEDALLEPNPEHPNGAIVIESRAPGSPRLAFPIPENAEIVERKPVRGFERQMVVVFDVSR